MKMSSVADGETASVMATNELSLAINAAELRADAVYKSGNRTLIDRISPAAWAKWDAIDENPLVADQNELGTSDPLDEELVAA